ncbi:hypothetical protein Tco_1302459 [Tanacetum coccineum]
MNPLIAQQVALDDALVAPEDRVEIGKCNMRIDRMKTRKEIFPKNPNQEFVEPPSHEDIVTFIKPICYKGALESILDLFTDHIYQPWRTFAFIINKYFVELIWEDFMYQIDNRQTSARRHESMPYPKFTKVIIQHFISKNKSISMRNRLFMHLIKNDNVFGRLTFVAKNEDNQVYGMLISYMMINKEFENSKAYQTYLAFLTGIAIPKKARKGTKAAITPKKKGSFTANDNIIPDPDVALELGKSISKTKAEEHEEARKVHETHERLVTAKPIRDEESDESDTEHARTPTGRRRQTRVTFRDTSNVSK